MAHTKKKAEVMATAESVSKSKVKKTKLVKAKKVVVEKKKASAIAKSGDLFIVKKAFSTNPEAVLYKIRTFVGWSAMVAVIFAGLSILSGYSTTGDIENLANKNSQASVLTADSTNDSQVAAPVVNPSTNNGALAPTLVTIEPQKDDVTLLAVGDVMLARLVEKKIRASKDNTYPFVNVKDILSTGDITFANLETPFFPGLTTVSGSYTFRADETSVEGLKAAGIDVVSLANNHIMNYRNAGLQTTLNALMGAGIKQVGAGQNISEANTPLMVESKGRKVAFLAFNDQNIAPHHHGEATETTSGIAKIDIEQMKKDVASAKAAGANFIIVSMHAGIEYRKDPTQTQKDFAHAAIDAGASVVIGHHPHVVEGVERYGKGIIMYSLGNFVFDQLFSEEVKTGLFARITLHGDGTVGAEFSPTSNEKSLQPRIIDGQLRVDMLNAMGVPMSL